VSDTELVFETALTASVERVFAALTEARELQHWFCDACESEPRVNGRLLMRWTRAGSSHEPFEARWVEFVPPARAGFQGGHAGYPDGNAGTVWYELAGTTTGTGLRVRHEWPAHKDYGALITPWREAWPRALERLRRHLAPREGARG
jgi:uncharacterized protein YndB with AHSA1/START domain